MDGQIGRIWDALKFKQPVIKFLTSLWLYFSIQAFA